MPVPWLGILEAVVGLTELARGRKSRAPAPGTAMQQLEASSRELGGLEARLAGVVVAALKEAFDRDTRRLELERAQLEAERRRAERALRLELLRQAGDREIGRLRLLAGVAVASGIGTLFFAARLAGGRVGPRVALGCGWILLLAAIAASFAAQSRVARVLERPAGSPDLNEIPDALSTGAAAALALWLTVVALGVIGLALLV
jgi:hypothetical protein